ncbi:FdhF/YdeP family oxidoreductase [Methylobacterium radiotolerans]|uniref:Oxidoreductase alpha (Molybdopterin) subunit n=1 Tax=Methylobacterium radiotolerans (strain ATCC 27329 / DSM 1819 / JCM 2831 / NBRC 15690 / NCIMB 10815 / 0-1) TaxID=426355 RepID=B1LX14_METRJ|nr:oxidoreductase alpha (molybdopterin) subunit [Methylobacterium radiotolerans JCM 2831]MBE7243697.1 FdhF/YdeP family oxidoreductase [Actinomycetospora chiangmaiensis]
MCPLFPGGTVRRSPPLDKPEFKPYRLPAGGWGSALSVGNILRREGVLASGPIALSRHNKVDGYQCNSCAWVKPASPLPFEYCENGVKAVAWELTAHRCTPDFFATHTVTELLDWDDYHLEQTGRLTHPLRYDPATDKYVPVSWGHAVEEIARELRAVPDRQKGTVFYSSGRLSNEASYLYQLFARLYGNNNLPDSSNMCHETTSVALPVSIGQAVGSVSLDDFAHSDCIMFFGQNPGSNAPRMLHPLQEASRRGVPIITYNPLRERGLERFLNPQSPTEMLTGKATRISSQYHQVKAGGDLAAIAGICKAVLALHDAARARGGDAVLDEAFIHDNTHGFDAFATWLRAQDWDELERRSGLHRADMESTAHVYSHAKATIGVYGMGLTQHRAGVETVQMLVNLLLMRGNIGRSGAGICPIRGHSNVQGQRTMGITEKPELFDLDRLGQQFAFAPPREPGYNTVEACEAILRDEVSAFVMLGGNFARAIPDHGQMEPAWRRIPLTVNVITKLNRTALLPGAISYVLPVTGRLEIVETSKGQQVLSMEDTSACVHGNRGLRRPASPHLISEIRLICELAQRVLDPNPRVRWAAYSEDFAEIRREIGETLPDSFWDYERRMWEPGGFQRDLPANRREWRTESGRANFVTPTGLDEDADMPDVGHDALRLMTLRSNDQFNTTVYGYYDRFRGIKNTRKVVLMNRSDIDRRGLKIGQPVTLRTVADDGVDRKLSGLLVVAYDIPIGCIGGYYPECNVLMPIWHYAIGSKTPAAKTIPVTVHPDSDAVLAPELEYATG